MNPAPATQPKPDERKGPAPVPTARHLTIHEAMPAIMAEIGAVGKTKRNTGQNYNFRGYDDVYLAVRDAIHRHGVTVTHTLQSAEWAKQSTAKGGEENWVRAVFRVRFTAADGSFTETDVFGEAMDNRDKAANKAMSMAMKYALVDTFLIPTEEPRDTENDPPEPKGEAKIAPEKIKLILGLFQRAGIVSGGERARIAEEVTGSHGQDMTATQGEKLAKHLVDLINQQKANGADKAAQ